MNPVTDDGRRLADAHEDARANGGVGRWLAVSLTNGYTTGEIYDDRADAIRHGGEHSFPVKVQPGPMPAAEGTGLIELHRRARAAGVDFTDPAHQPVLPTRGPLPQLHIPRRALRAAESSGLIVPNRADRRRYRHG